MPEINCNVYVFFVSPGGEFVKEGYDYFTVPGCRVPATTFAIAKDFHLKIASYKLET
jgi:hypothetical protein